MTVRFKLAALLVVSVLASWLFSASGKPSVHVEPMDSVGPRPVEAQTQSSIIRDYLAAWRSLNQSMTENRPELLDAYFVGLAKQNLAQTVHQQQSLGIHTTYRDTAHHIRVVFYSPEGLSIQLLDDVEYEEQVTDHDRSIGSSHIRTRYIAVLTPTESKWKVRIFQGGAY